MTPGRSHRSVFGTDKGVMSTATARVIRRVVTAAGTAGGALALLGWIGLSSASAEPTPDPTPTSSVTPPPAPASPSPAPSVEEATPTPIPTESGTSPGSAPSVEEVTPTPSHTDSPTSPTPAPLTEEATRTPGPTQLPTPRSSAVESQGVAALAEPVADERLYVVVRTQCDGDDGPTLVDVSLYLLTAEDLTLDYVLTNDEGITRTGTVTLTPEDSQASEDPHGTLEFTGLPVGLYHIDFRPDGGGEPVTVQNFEILNCIVTAVSCQQVTFANPTTNPTVGLTVGNGPVDDEDYQDFELEPGERRVFRTDRGVINWLAGTLEGQAGENFSIAYAGEDEEVSVPAECEPGPSAEPGDGLAGPGRGLADTGGTTYALGGLASGALLTTAGTTLLVRRRLT
jgi:hypothetical protein